MPYQNFNCYLVIQKKIDGSEDVTEESMELDIRTKLVRESKIRKYVLNKLKITNDQVLIFKTFKKMG